MAINFAKDLKIMQWKFLQRKMDNVSVINIICMCTVLLTCHVESVRSSTIDDTLSFKSLVLGSLSSGQNASGRYIIEYVTQEYIIDDCE